MRKYFLNKPVFIIVLSLLVFLFALGMIYNPDYQNNPRVYEMSVLCAQGDTGRFQNFRQGALQAAQDLNVNLRFSYTKSENGINHQMQLLKKELTNSSEAIIVAPFSDSGILLKYAKTSTKPLLYAYSHMIKDEFNYIGSSGAEMGNDFALEIMQRGNYRKHIAIVVKNNTNCTEKAMIESMQEVFKTAVNQVDVLSFHPEESLNTLCHMLDSNDYDVVICLDDSLCNQLIEHKSIHDVEIYAMGSSSYLINALEEDKITALLVQDEYSIGYLSVKNAVQAIKNHKNVSFSNVKYAIVDKEHMYESSNERLLFPIVR